MRWSNSWMVLAVCALCGCTTVSSVEPLGAQPKQLKEEEWAGTWLHRNQPVLIRLVDPQQGQIEVGWVEEKQGALKLESYQITLRESGDWTFGNVKDTEAPDRYYWGVVGMEEGQMVIWTPDAKRCAALVKSGAIPGAVDKDGDVKLDRLTPEQTLRITAPESGGCIAWTEPLVFFRLGK